MSPCPNISEVALAGDTPEKRTFGLVIYALGQVFAVLCLAVFLWGKHVVKFERLKTRYDAMVLSVFVGVMIQHQGDTLEMFVGSPNYYCVVKLVISLLIIPFVAAGIVGKLFSFFFRSRFERQAILDRKDENDVTEESESVTEDRTGKRKMVGMMTKGAKELFFFRSADASLNLASLRFLQSPFASVSLLIMNFLIPSIICGVVMAAADPLMASGCTGCLTNYTIGGFLVVQATVTASLIVLAVIRVRHFPDPWGIIPEVVACIGFSAISILGYALSFLLNVTFPVWSFSFLLAFGLSGVLFTQTILQVIIAWYKEGLSSSNPGSSKKKVMDAFGSDARAHTRSVISGKPQLHQILSDPEQAARFEEHLGREFGVESLYFYRDAQKWAKEYNDVSVNTRKARAKHIVKVYIRNNGVFAINIPSTMSKALISAVDEQVNPPPDFFMDAILEVQQLLEKGALNRFLIQERKRGNEVLAVPA